MSHHEETSCVSTGARASQKAAAILLALGVAAMGGAADAQNAAWFGLPAPGPATEQALDFNNTDFKQIPAPAVGRDVEFEGQKLHDEMRKITRFSYMSRDAGDRLWGRVAGSPANEAAIDYVFSELKAAGVTDLEKVLVPFEGPEALPKDWKVEILGAPETGNVGQAVTLQSAMPRAATGDGRALSVEQRKTIEEHPTRTITAPLMYAGDASPAALSSIDLKGKIAVVRVPANPASFYNVQFYGAPGNAIRAGAVGVLVIFEGPGNMQTRAGTCFPEICVNLGNEDGAFIEALLGKAAAAGVRGKIQARLTLTETVDAKRVSHMVIGRIKGASSEENIVINAHSDGWFAAASDNGNGVAGLLALARYYGKPRNKPRHDMYFVLGAGHHSPTKDSLPLVRYAPELVKKNIVMLNLEHISSIGIVRSAYGVLMSPTIPRDRYDNVVFPFYPTNWDTQLRSVSMRPLDSAVLKGVWESAAQKNYLTSAARVVGPASGETRPFTMAGGASINNVEANLWYHTSGDTPETISPEGMQRALLFFRDFINGMDKLKRADIQPTG